MNQQSQAHHTSLVKQLKSLFKNLPRLAIPESSDQLIVETDAYKNIGEEFLKPKRAIIASMFVDMPMDVLNQPKSITIVMKKNF